MNNKNTLQDYINKIKTFFVQMPKERKKKLGIGVGVIVALAVGIAIILNIGKPGLKVLYKGLDTDEASSVYASLQEMGISPEMNGAGDIMVPASKYDSCLLELASQGYPKSTLSYNLFADHSGLTSTETEKKQWITYQLQDRIQSTLKQIDGVTNSTVTINIPETSDYVWDQVNANDTSTASVLLSLRAGTSLSDQQITAIKNLVASGTPRMDPDNVTVVDANTMLELGGSSASSGESLECEQLVQKQIEQNITRLLMPRYGADGVVAVAKVTLNYDKMMTEKLEKVEKPVNEDGTGGGGYVTHSEGSYNLNGAETAGNIVGEENNTDIPTYAYNEAGEENSLTDYSWSTDTDYGYIKTQIEKGQAELKNATVSVLVNDDNLSAQEKAELLALVSKGADIAEENIYVSTFVKTAPEQAETPTASLAFLLEMPWILVLAGSFVLLLILLILIFVFRRKSKRAKLRARQNEKDRLEAEEEERRQQMEQEIADYKKKLSASADPDADVKSEAIVKDVRDFARQNPEVTASLLRSWIKEGDQQ